MRKTFFFAVMALFAINTMAQSEETFPKVVGYEYGYKLNGVTRGTFNTDMLKQVVAAEAERQDGNFTAVARRWFSSVEKSGYDTLANYEFNKHKAVVFDEKGLESDEYKDVLWTIQITVIANSETDTVKNLLFHYSTNKYLTYYTEADTSYTAYAGRPYRMQQVVNPMYLPLTFTSSDPKVATVDPKSGEITVVAKGETMIEAAFPGNEDIGPKSAEWKLVVKEGDHYVLEIITPYQVEKPWGSSGTYWAFDRIKVTEANCNDIYGDGKLSFDIKTRTLKMNNYKREYSDEEDSSMGWTDWLDYESGPLPLNIQIIGTCEILHNSAGFNAGYNMRIFGDGKDKSRLTLLGRFPQLHAENELVIDGVQVHAIATTPHPLMMCKTLRVEDDSHFDANVDIEVEEGEDPREWGASVGVVEEVEFGDNIIMLSKDVHIEDGQFIDGEGKIALRVEIGPKIEDVLAGEVTFEALELTDDPTGTEVDGILYTLTEADGVDKTEGCLALYSPMDVDKVPEILADYLPGSTAFAEHFNGLTFLLPVGKGVIKVKVQTVGIIHLAVQIGNNLPTLVQKNEVSEVEIPFDNKIATFAYIYAGAMYYDAAPARRSTQDASRLMIYSLAVDSESMDIDEISESSNGESFKFVRNGQLLILRDGKLYNVTGVEVK